MPLITDAERRVLRCGSYGTYLKRSQFDCSPSLALLESMAKKGWLDRAASNGEPVFRVSDWGHQVADAREENGRLILHTMQTGIDGWPEPIEEDVTERRCWIS